MLRFLLLIAVLGLSTAKADDFTLEDARKVSIESSMQPKSGWCRGEFRASLQEKGDPAPVIWTEGTFKLSFKEDKLLLDMKFSTRKVRVVQVNADGTKSEPKIVNAPLDRLVVLDDGNTVSMITFTPRIHPSGCRIELFSNLQSTLGFAEFPLRDPIHPHLGILDIDKLIKNLGPDAIEWSRQKGTIYQGSFRAKNSKDVRIVFQVDAASGKRLTSMSVFNPKSDEPGSSRKLKWAKKNETWFVQEIKTKSRFRDRPLRMEEVIFTDYQPNLPLTDKEFDMSSIDIPPRTRTIDRRR